HGKRQQLGLRFHLQTLAGKIDAAAEIERPAVAFHWHLVPPMQLLQLKAAADLNVIRGSGQLDAGSGRPMNANVPAENERADLTQSASLELEAEVHVIRPPVAPSSDTLLIGMGGTVRAAGLAGKTQVPIRRAVRSGDRIQVHVVDVVDGFRVAKLKIDAAGAHFN